MDVVNFIISLVSGAVGGNAAGAAMKDKSLGTLWNSISGILGGGIGGAILQMLGVMSKGGNLDIGSILANIAGGGVGGGILMAIVAALKGGLAKKP
jgi:uncharacterized membrane protein YeaQ/YmgE (transglycosylase-associated protein family)